MPNQFFSPEGDIENYYVTESWMIDQYIGDQLWVWGRNSILVLGTNDTVGRTTPSLIFGGGNNWKQIALGSWHAAGIKTDGSLWTWGYNWNSALGINDTVSANSKSTPVTTFAGGNDWRQVSCGYAVTAAIKTDGSLWMWGRNSYGQLGINNVSERATPVTTFAGGNNWKQVSMAPYGAGAIKTDGTLWMWGNANNGSMGINVLGNINKSTPVTTFAGGNNWKQISCTSGCTAAIKTDGTLWVWGYRFSLGTLNLSVDRLTPVTTFIGGNDWKDVSLNNTAGSVYGIKTDGSLWCWGGNGSGSLGTNDAIVKSTPVTTFAGGNDWKSLSKGGRANSTIAAIKTDGSLWIWGSNSNLYLGSGDNISRSTPITTFAGGNNWRQIAIGDWSSAAVTSGIDPLFSLS